MAEIDFAKCERPDELIRLAWDAGLDRKLVIREGSDAARFLLGGELNNMAKLFWPVPRPLEAVDRWSENPHLLIAEDLRPNASAVAPGCVLGAIVGHFFVTPRLPAEAEEMALTVVIVATMALLGVVLKVLIAAALRRQVARLDENTAFVIVLVQLRRGMIASPRHVPQACQWIRRGLEMPAFEDRDR